MRTPVVWLATLLFTLFCGSGALLGALLGLKEREGSVFDRMPRWWGKAVAWAAGVTVVTHGDEHRLGAQHVFVANHVALFDIIVLASRLTWIKFVAKNELSRIPFFGRAARAAGTVFLQRENRKSAFESYREAADKIHEGASVVVFAEGTRASYYALRPFKKGPFVLAISAQAPIIPTLIHGTIEVNRKGDLLIRSGTVNVHFLEPVPTAGLDYDDRDTLAMTVRDRMAELLLREYGVASPPWDPRRSRS